MRIFVDIWSYLLKIWKYKNLFIWNKDNLAWNLLVQIISKDFNISFGGNWSQYPVVDCSCAILTLVRVSPLLSFDRKQSFSLSATKLGSNTSVVLTLAFTRAPPNPVTHSLALYSRIETLCWPWSWQHPMSPRFVSSILIVSLANPDVETHP